MDVVESGGMVVVLILGVVAVFALLVLAGLVVPEDYGEGDGDESP